MQALSHVRSRVTCATLFAASLTMLGAFAQAQSPAAASKPALKAAPKQDASAATAQFYKAFYYDQGLANTARALALYEGFLKKHAEHRYASRAARFALDLLLRTKQQERAKAFHKAHASLLGASVKPGINSGYLDPKMSSEKMVARFEGESREIWFHRGKLLKLMKLEEGMAVADIGAGTGLFTWPMSRAVGERGKVYAVDISEGMLAHLTKEKTRRKKPNVSVVACNERSSQLPEASCDLVWICDTYHHFEFPAETMATIYRAMRPGGSLILVDFERIPGKSRPWILGHVRAGKSVFRKEVEAAGFKFVEEVKTPLEENYFLRFEK